MVSLNKSQLLKRSISGISNHAKVMVERLKIPIVFGFLHPSSKKVMFLMDSETDKIMMTENTLDKIETVLHDSKASGNTLDFIDYCDKRCESVKDSSKLRSHLPTPQYPLIREKNKMDYDSIRKLLGAALHAEGFGRGSGKLRYQDMHNKPEWFDEVLEKDIGVTWECFTGLNTRFYKQKEAMYLILLKIYKF